MTSDLPAGPNVDYEMARFVRRVRTRAMRTLGEIHPKLDYGNFLFLVAICDAPNGIRGSELAEAMGVHKSTASRGASTLERLGLVHRVPDAADGRAHLLVASGDAQQRIADYRKRAQQRSRVLFQDWTDQEIAAFATALSRLNDDAERFD